METLTAVQILAALAHETRLSVFRLLVQVGETGMTAGKISEICEVPASSLSFHLKELSHANLVISNQVGRFITYKANFIAMQNLIEFLTEDCCQGKPCHLSSVECNTSEGKK